MRVILLISIVGAVGLTVFTAADISQVWMIPVVFIAGVVALTLLYWGILGIFSLFYSVGKEYEKPSALSLFMLNAAYWFVCSAGNIRVHTGGMEKIPAEGRFLFVSNHLSRFDPMIQSLVLRHTPIAFISKPSNFKIPIGRRFMNRSCYISIDRQNPRNAAQAINRAAKLLKNGVISVGVYPEGHRGTGYELQEFKPGCLKAAIKSECPIVVAVIRGTEQIHKNAPWRKTDIYLDIIDVIKPDNKEKTVDLSENIRSEMQKHLIKIKQEEK